MEIIFDNIRKDMEFSGDVSALLRRLGVMREEVVVKVNGRLAPETRALSSPDRVEVIRVVFGG